MQPRGDVDAIAKDIAILLDDVTQMNADAHVNLFGFFFLGIVGLQLRLNRLGALNGVDDGGEVDEEGIADGFDDRAVMRQQPLAE